jgi:uncharacterized protein (DUF885 family)
MERVTSEAGFGGRLPQFFEFLRTDPKFFFSDAQALLAGYRDLAKRVDPELVKLFRHLPRLPYGVAAVPAHSEQAMPAAYYMQGAMESGRPGLFYANTYHLKSRPNWEMESLTLHEAVPGHHLQLALAQEAQSLPAFRRYASYTSFVEGWALYAESLGRELGLYRSPYSHFGQLVNEMWRAVRLVVDTGMHAKGWSREQALRFFMENAGRPEVDVAVEVDRYIAWAGQALAYKVGELKIKELRRKAEQAQKGRFDVRCFHDFVLGEGALPMAALERRVNEWLEAGGPCPAY